MTKSIAIVSAGGQARSVADVIFSLPEYKLVAFLDTPYSPGEAIFGVPVTEVTWPLTVLPGEGAECLALGQGSNFKRSERMEQLSKLGIPFPPLIHPTAYIGHDVEIGEGSVVMPGAVVNVSARIGRGCVINSGCVLKHGVIVDDFVSVSPGAAIAADVTLESHVYVGIGASINGGLKIGEGTVVGSGAVVVKDLEPGILAIGLPARKARDLPPGWSPV